MRELAIIPARGGSRGVPGKNLMTIGGRPLLGHAIRCCQEAGVSAVVVTTDCLQIADEADRYGAFVTTRPGELAGDASSSQDAVRHVMETRQADLIAMVQCTSPMLHKSDIRGCLDKVADRDIVVCCVPFDGLVLSAEGRPQNYRLGMSQRRQERPAQFVVNGHCWAFRPSYLQRDWLTGNVGLHLAKFPYRLEIDEPDDVELARTVIENHLL